MISTAIHPLALVEPGARLGAGVSVGPFAHIESGAVLGDGCVIAAHAVIRAHAALAERVTVESFCVIGGDPQDHAFDKSLITGVAIGARTVLREGVTIHRATNPGQNTIIGENCLIMCAAHVAHDARLGDGVTLANGALLAGHVVVGDRAFISGNVAVHQFCRIGAMTMISGVSYMTEDVPPYCVAAERNRLAGLNVVGLRRGGVPAASVADIRACYRRLFLESGRMNLSENLLSAREDGLGSTPEGAAFLAFFDGGVRRRFCRPHRFRSGKDAD